MEFESEILPNGNPPFRRMRPRYQTAKEQKNAEGFFEILV
jgi:hypothetical protein